MRAAAWGFILLSLLLAGCADRGTADESHGARVPQGSAIGRTPIAIVLPEMEPEEPAASPAPRLSADANGTFVVALPDGTTASAFRVYVRETTWRHDRETGSAIEVTRGNCGGALFAAAPELGDPRDAALTFVERTRVGDPQNRTWTTDRYVIGDDASNFSASVWIANVGGGDAFVADDGERHCPPAQHDGRPHNVVLHVVGVDEVAVYYDALRRPAAPADAAPDADGAAVNETGRGPS